MAISKILVPVDYSESSREALLCAASLSRALDAELDVIHVWDEPRYVADANVVGSTGGTQSIAELIRESAEAEMTEFLARCALPADLRLTHRLESGEPTSTILRCIKASGCDLAVMGTHGRSGVRHLLLGSVAEKLVRLANVPVLTVPAAKSG